MSDTTICHTQAHLHISHKAQNETCKTNSTPATCTFMRIGNNSEPLRVPENHMYKWLFHTCKLINHRSTKSIYEYAYGHQYQQYTNHTCIVLMIQHANAHKKKQKHTMDRKSMGAPEHWFYKGFDHFNQNQTWLTHTHTTGTTKTHSILHRPAPQIRWHWASPSPFALFGTPKTAQPMYTPISPFHPQIITIKSKTCHYQAK